MILVESMKKMGYEPKEVEESLKQWKYDDITATYLLLGRKPLNEVNNKCLHLLFVLVLYISGGLNPQKYLPLCIELTYVRSTCSCDKFVNMVSLQIHILIVGYCGDQ